MAETSDDFHARGALALSLAWTLVLAVLGRLVGMKDHGTAADEPYLRHSCI
jgi:hypothetical protein